MNQSVRLHSGPGGLQQPSADSQPKKDNIRISQFPKPTNNGMSIFHCVCWATLPTGALR